MRYIMHTRFFFGAMLLFAAFGVALAQGTNLLLGSFNLDQYFKDTASLAALVGTVVALVREHGPATITERLKGYWVVLFSVVTGIVLAFVGKWLGATALSGDWFAAVLFGGQAGLIASGAVDLVRGILGGALKAGGANATLAPNSTTAVDAASLRRGS